MSRVVNQSKDLWSLLLSVPVQLLLLRTSFIYTFSKHIGLWDYGNKQWQGITKDFYSPRYSLYAARAISAITSHSPFNTTGYVEDVSELAQAWTTAHLPESRYPTQPLGDALAISRALFEKYAANYTNVTAAT